MKILFIQGGSRWKYDTEGGVYTDSNFSEQVWARYQALGDLTVLLRREDQVYDPGEAAARFNRVDTEKMSCVPLPDLYRPARRLLDPALRRRVGQAIEKAVRQADRVIVRSPGNFYTNTALAACRRQHRPCLVEVTGFAWEGSWYHSPAGKLLGPLAGAAVPGPGGRGPLGGVCDPARLCSSATPAGAKPWAARTWSWPLWTRRCWRPGWPASGRGRRPWSSEQRAFWMWLTKVSGGSLRPWPCCAGKASPGSAINWRGRAAARPCWPHARRLGVADQVELMGSLPRHRMGRLVRRAGPLHPPQRQRGAVPVDCGGHEPRGSGGLHPGRGQCGSWQTPPFSLAGGTLPASPTPWNGWQTPPPGQRRPAAALTPPGPLTARPWTGVRKEFYQAFVHEEDQNPCAD